MASSVWEQDFIVGKKLVAGRELPVVGAELSAADRLGGCKARWGIGRMDYTVFPGLYALGDPGPDAPLLATANYKLTFDALRRSLPGRGVWILALDTNGINVWCAAGKGTMGTDNLVWALSHHRVAEVVNHRRVIAPQLAAPGVSAHRVKKQSGFQVAFGPIRSVDLPAYLDNGQRPTPAMRRVEFPWRDRLVLAPMELAPALKIAAPAALALALLASLLGTGPFARNLAGPGFFACAAFLAASLAGSVLGPALLPFLPGRAFALKGLWLGLAWSGLTLWALAAALPAHLGWTAALAWVLLPTALVSFLLMNFTGSSTYTSLSGVKAEMRLAVPLQAAAALAGLVFWALSLL